MKHECRICHVFTFAELEDLMQNLLDDRTIHIEEGYPTISMYSDGSDVCYEEGEILDRIGRCLERNLSWAFLLYDTKEIYIVESEKITDGMPLLLRWEWIDSNTFIGSFGFRIDEDGEEYELVGGYQTDTGTWAFSKLYEDDQISVRRKDYTESMREQMETILRQEGVTV